MSLIFGTHVTFTTSENVTVMSIFAHHVYVPLAAIDVTFVTTGLIVSIPFTVITTSLILSQPSDNLIVNVSVHENHNLG